MPFTKQLCVFSAFTVSLNTCRMSVVRYSSEVDLTSIILLRDFPDDKGGLLSAFDAIPYDGRGKWKYLYIFQQI